MRPLRSIHRLKILPAVALVAAGGLALAVRYGPGRTAYCPIDGAGVAVSPAGGFAGPAVSLPADLEAIGSTEERKRIFVSVVLPLALRVNRAVLADRRFVEAAAACGDAGRPLAPAARARLDRLAAAYDAAGDPSALRLRLDTVPPSLLLAQAAIESGWGTSRFARQGNALFGQRTTAADGGMRPQGVEAAAAVRVAAFPHLLASVRSYVHNLNTQPAYRTFRRLRAALRERGRRPGGLDLATTLTAYSERGPAYVRDLEAIIRDNRFDAFDRAPRLAGGGPGGRRPVA